MGLVVLVVVLFSPVNIIPPILPSHLHLHVVVIRRVKGRCLRTFQNIIPLRKWGGAFDRKVLSLSHSRIKREQAPPQNTMVMFRKFRSLAGFRSVWRGLCLVTCKVKSS